MFRVIGVEIVVNPLNGGGIRARRHRPLNGLVDAVAHEAADVVHRPEGQAFFCQPVVHRRCQIGDGVQNRAVQIKDREFVFHGVSPLRQPRMPRCSSRIFVPMRIRITPPAISAFF